ncbi:MAG: Rpn family recombination-promoting nuclease/putative transposase [Planctomycetes bacterium]|nr:Rpn family recombination-promoting nuclease/putative transposase [Planctomycetota bacterium]
MVDAHDTLFRTAFQHTHTIRALLAWLLPAALRAAVLAGILEPWPASASDRRLRVHHADLMFVLRLSPRLAILFVLEHKSWADRKLLRQLHRYVMQVTHNRMRTRMAACCSSFR